MPDEAKTKVGIVSCSGEEIAAGTVSRVATRLVLERLRPGQTTTICLPLFLAGDGGERFFAKFFPTITVDGCEKMCAYRATKKLSNQPVAGIVVSEVAERCPGCVPTSRRELGAGGEALAAAVAREIAAEVDAALERVEAAARDRAASQREER